jgi:hypothetical protein
VGLPVLAVVLALLLYDKFVLTTDAVMALAWGAEFAEGELPDTSAPLLPVFHPLPTLVGVLLSPLGAGAAVDAYRMIAVLSLFLLAYSVFRLGGSLGAIATGAVAALMVLTRPEAIDYARASAIDIPFAALVLLALALALERPRGHRWAVLGLLSAAGLLRPEAWLLAIAYGAWLALRTQGRTRALVVALALSAPLIWLGADLAMTGDPLNSAAQARSGEGGGELAAAGYPASSPGGGRGDGSQETTWDTIRTHWESVTAALGWPLALAGIAAGLVALGRAYRGRARWPSWRDDEPRLDLDLRAALVALPAFAILLALLVLRLGGTVFAFRFVLLPAFALAVLFAAALVRFQPPAAWRALLAVAATALLVTLPGDVGEIVDQGDRFDRGSTAIDEAAALADDSAAQRALEDCPDAATVGIRFSTFAMGLLARAVDRDPASIDQLYAPPPRYDTVIAYGSYPRVARGGPDRRRLVARRGLWELWSRCPP